MIWLVLLIACPKHGPSIEAGLPIERREVTEVDPTRVGVPSPGTWRGGGLAVDIPAGWTAREGSGTGLILSLQRADGVAMEIWTFDPSEGLPFPRTREGCDPLFTDSSAYRAIPGLPVSRVSTCVPDEAEGIVVDGWYAEVAGRQIHVDALLPAGRVFEGRSAIAPILGSLRVEGGENP